MNEEARAQENQVQDVRDHLGFDEHFCTQCGVVMMKQHDDCPVCKGKVKRLRDHVAEVHEKIRLEEMDEHELGADRVKIEGADPANPPKVTELRPRTSPLDPTTPDPSMQSVSGDAPQNAAADAGQDAGQEVGQQNEQAQQGQA